MRINIIVPPKTNYLSLILKSKNFFRYKGVPRHILIDKNKRYCIFIHKNYIRIYIELASQDVLNEIKNYIETLFKGKYIGLLKSQKELLKFTKIRVVPL